MKKLSPDPEIVRITNGNARSSSWEKLQTSNGVLYVGSRGPKVNYGLSKKNPSPPKRIKPHKTTSGEEAPPIVDLHLTMKLPDPPFGTIKGGKPQSHFLRQ
jgi:hypothetical protein